MAKIQEIGDMELINLYRSVIAELGTLHVIAQKVRAEVERRGLHKPRIVH